MLGRGTLWLLVGYAEKALGHTVEAVTAHHNAVRYLPDSVDAQLALGASLGRAGQHEAALSALRAALATTPDRLTVAWANLSSALANLDRVEASLDAYQHVLRVVPATDADLLIKVALLAASLNLHEDAVELLARYLCAAQGQERVHDEPALAVVDRAPAEHVARLANIGALGAALAAVRAEASSCELTPDDMKIPTKITLDPEGWSRFVALAGLSRGAGVGA